MSLWTVSGGQQLSWQAHPEAVFALCFLRDSQELVSVGRSGAVRVWSVATGAAVLRAEAQGTSPALAVAAAPNGRSVAIGGVGRVTLWGLDGAQLAPLAELTAPPYPINAVTFSPDGNAIAAGNSGDGGALVWRLGGGEPEQVAVSPECQARGLCFAADGSSLVAVDTAGNVTRGRAGASPVSLGRLPGPSIRQAGASHDGQRFVAAHADGTARLTVPTGVAER